MGEPIKFYIKQDRFYSKENDLLNSWTITTNQEYCGWRTDSGYDGYGLPKELALWICKILNDSIENCPYEMKDNYWERNEKPR